MASAIREKIQDLLKSRPDVTLADIAGQTDRTESTVKKVMAGIQEASADLTRQLDQAVDRILAGDVVPLGQAVVVTEDRGTRRRMRTDKHGFYVTDTVRKVAKVAEYCASEAAIGVVTAGFGCGKTEAICSWRAANARKYESVLFEFDEFTRASKVALIETLAEMLGCAIRRGTTNASASFRAVCEYLRENPCLLIFDQCETVAPAVFQVIRQIWDRTREAGVGVLLLAAPVLLTRLKACTLRDLGALESRIGIVAPLRGVSREEMAAIVKSEGVTQVTEDAFDLWWKATDGSMRRLMTSLALIKTSHAGKDVTAKTIHGVAGHLWGMAA